MRQYNRHFAGVPASVGAARRWVRVVLAEIDCCQNTAEAAELIVSELASNAVSYTASGCPGGSFRAGVAHGAGLVRVEVADQGAEAEPLVGGDGGDWDQVHGRGLWMISQLALRLVIIGDHNGRLVFADLPTHTTPETTGQQTSPDRTAGRVVEAGGAPATGVLRSGEPGAWAALIPALEALITDDSMLMRELQALLENPPPATTPGTPPGAPPRPPRPG